MMRRIAVFLAILVLAGRLELDAQSSSRSSRKGEDSIPTDSPVNQSAALDEIKALLREQARLLQTQQHQLERQQAEIDELRRQVAPQKGAEILAAIDQEYDAAKDAALLRNASLSFTRPIHQTNVSPVVTAAIAQAGKGTETGDSPLSIHFGKASLTPGGCVDFTSYYRSADVGSGLGTSFGTIPYSNTVLGGLSETHFTAQGSRLSLRADETFGSVRVFGYAEADFNGYLPPNGYVSTNSDSLRLRVYFTDLKRSRWELLAGQSWSMLTPNRVGVSPFLSEIYNTLHLDSNYQVGLTYARQTQIRAVYHFTDNLALGLSAENPQQFSGGAATFPALFNTTQTDLGSSSGAGGGTATPNVHPDLIGKLSLDPRWGNRAWHLETAGLLTGVGILTPASVTKGPVAKDTREGGGVSAAANIEAGRTLHIIATGFWSDGGGRYIGGLGPAFVVAQRDSTTSAFSAQMIHAGSFIAGAEWRPTRNTVIALTYSGAYFARSFSFDPSTRTLIGYGYPGSANSNNRSVQEGTLATQTKLWTRPGYGSVQVITQSSYIARSPWSLNPGSPSSARVFVGYANLRYVLP
ncbi:coiled-coil domain-containing protein [Occallatibacter savannae]|uniref:coiled-coil domain-containing protein n=1 Tax=Occallatibacter savannae TaxID=1002691 RepID=UPI0013A5A3AB|nr:hypothetical protein [Occallatibacter savannae]